MEHPPLWNDRDNPEPPEFICDEFYAKVKELTEPANRAETLVKPQGEFLPCPFCGGEPKYHKGFLLGTMHHTVFCKKCGGSGDPTIWNKRASQ